MNETRRTHLIKIARGNVYLPVQTYNTYLKNIEAVALLPHEEGFLIFPLIRESAGGVLIKIKNLAGDRIIHAQEFFRNNSIPESFDEIVCDAWWERERHALLVAVPAS